jgi:hypothetical protein
MNWRGTIRASIVVSLAILLSGSLWAQEAPINSAETEEADLRRENQELRTKNADYLKALEEASQLIDVNFIDAMREQNNYAIEKYRHLSWLDGYAKKLFVWQITALWGLSAITLAVTLMAIVTALSGLKTSFRIMGSRTEMEQEIDGLFSGLGADPQSASAAKERLLSKFSGSAADIDVGPSGIKITSAATWVTVLLIAFGYLYLFVTEAMNISEINFGMPETGGVSQTDSAPPGRTSNGKTEPPPTCEGEACDRPGD